jgi:hypothetical protein
MITASLYTAIQKYIMPLLGFGWITIDEQGFLVERNETKPLYYINDKYSGQPGECPRIYPVVPISDERYIQIRQSPELEVFDPFHSIKHMELVFLEFKRGLINYALSDETVDKYSLGELEDMIKFSYCGVPNTNLIRTELSNVEDPNDIKQMFYYESEDAIMSIWGLCVTSYNAVDRKHDDYFYDIGKAWRAAMRLANKWYKEKNNIAIPKNTEQNKLDSGYANIDVTGEYSPKMIDCNKDYFLKDNDMNNYLTSLFDKESLKPVEIGEENIASPAAIPFFETKYVFPDFASDETIFKTALPSKLRDKEIEVAVIEAEKEDNSIILDRGIDDKTDLPGAGNAAPEPKRESLFTRLRNQNRGPMPFNNGFQNNMFGPGFQYPQGQFGGNMYYQNMGNSIPNSIDSIDFESSEHPDPCAFYRTNR